MTGLATNMNELENKLIEVETFAQENRVHVNSLNENESTCGDGRTAVKTAHERPLRQFGGDAGDLVTAMAAVNKYVSESGGTVSQFYREIIRDAIYAVVGGKDKMYIHTDTHALHDEKTQAVDPNCGYIQQVITSPSLFGLSPEDIQFMRGTVDQLKKDGVTQDVLDGKHGELGLIRVEKGSIATQNMQGVQYFVLTDELIAKRNEKVVSALSSALVFDKAKFGSLYSVIKEQNHLHTAHALAPDASIYSVAFAYDGGAKAALVGKA